MTFPYAIRIWAAETAACCDKCTVVYSIEVSIPLFTALWGRIISGPNDDVIEVLGAGTNVAACKPLVVTLLQECGLWLTLSTSHAVLHHYPYALPLPHATVMQLPVSLYSVPTS